MLALTKVIVRVAFNIIGSIEFQVQAAILSKMARDYYDLGDFEEALEFQKQSALIYYQARIFYELKHT